MAYTQVITRIVGNAVNVYFIVFYLQLSVTLKVKSYDMLQYALVKRETFL